MPYLKYLGPAFGTKFLYFLTAASNDVDTTPVLDAVIRRWFTKHAEVKLYTAWWDLDSYSRYLGLLGEWRTQLPAPPDQDPSNGGRSSCSSSRRSAGTRTRG